jgi:plastocyanin domain-containing protein
MGMIRSSITVVAEGETAAVSAEPDIRPVPAGVSIATDSVAIAEMNADGWQTVTINLRDEGFSPAIIVVQKYVPVAWVINNDSLDEGNSGLVVPAYNTKMELDQGDNEIGFMPEGDFDFSTADNIFYGYVKAVDDLNNVDIEAIKAEVGGFEPQIYPDAYFEAAAAAQGGCCGSAGV